MLLAVEKQSFRITDIGLHDRRPVGTLLLCPRTGHAAVVNQCRAALHTVAGKDGDDLFQALRSNKGPDDEVVSLERALAGGVYHFDGSIQFKRAGIFLKEATSDEILAAVKDMIAWVKRPDLPETALQLRIREAAEQVAQDLARRGGDLDLPIGDFLGISLPGYRISPTVAAMRERRTTTGGTLTTAGRPCYGTISA